jgi:hypothetical protein
MTISVALPSDLAEADALIRRQRDELATAEACAAGAARSRLEAS